jgi:anti-sigma factor RsiW
MNCDRMRELLDPYLDGELDLVTSLSLERHLQECPACQALHVRGQAIRKAMQQPGLYAKAPVDLDGKLRDRLRGDVREARPTGPMLRWGSLAAGIAALALVSGIWMKQWQNASADHAVEREVTDSHVRSLMANHLTDVLSSDQHTVKPWFNGKLDFTPMVKDLAPQGFPLIGGRLDYLNDRPVAGLLYKRNQHPINLFEWPATATEGPRTAALRGYNLIHWSQSGMVFWAISDLNALELREFASYLQR